MAIFDEFIKTFLNDEKISTYAGANVGSQTSLALKEPLTTLRMVLERANAVDQFIVGNQLSIINGAITELSPNLTKLLNFDASTSNSPGSELTELGRLVQSAIDVIIPAALPSIAMSGEADALKVRAAEVEVGRIVEKLKKIENVEGTRQGAHASDDASSFFEEKAGAYKQAVSNYSIALGVVILLTISGTLWYAVDLISYLDSNPNVNSNIFARSLPALNILAVAWFLIRLLAKNVRNNQHLRIVNETKSMILRSGQQFSLSVVGASVATAVLERIITATFVVGNTGYLPSELDGSPSDMSTLLSLLKSTTSRP